MPIVTIGQRSDLSDRWAKALSNMRVYPGADIMVWPSADSPSVCVVTWKMVIHGQQYGRFIVVDFPPDAPSTVRAMDFLLGMQIADCVRLVKEQRLSTRGKSMGKGKGCGGKKPGR